MPGSFDKKYRSDALKLKNSRATSGEVRWKCPSNIALVKYWGKRNFQLPMNPSISMTLKNCTTDIHIEYEIQHTHNKPIWDFSMNGSADDTTQRRVQNYLEHITRYLPFILNYRLMIKSTNNFPHAAGIASSASAFGALALALCSIENDFYLTLNNAEEFFRKASFLARLGSGSASRSVYGGYVCWGENDNLQNSSDETAVSLYKIDDIYHEMCDTILVVDSSQKLVSSSEGHRLMANHMFEKQRYSQAYDNISDILKYLRKGSVYDFMELVEKEALTLHAMMMTSSSPYVLIQPNTLEIMQRVTHYRRKQYIPVGFTLDAGPNVHILYPQSVANEVNMFIQSELLSFCENGRYIYDGVGEGPDRV